MTTEQIFDTYLTYNKWLKELQEHEKDLILYMLREYAKLMCDKQREICDQAFSDYNWTTNKDPYCVINASYPDELQSNN